MTPPARARTGPTRAVRALVGSALAGLRARRARAARSGATGPPAPARARDGRVSLRPRGLVLRGTVWTGGDTAPIAGLVVLDGAGRVARITPDRVPVAGPPAGPSAGRPTGPPAALPAGWPADLPVLGGVGCWIGPAPGDAHVHLAQCEPAAAAAVLRAGVVAVRDLGAPLDRLVRWRAAGHGSLRAAVAGPMLTAPHGYPSTRRGGPPAGLGVATPGDARPVVARLVAAGVDVCKIVLDRGPGDWPSPEPEVVLALVGAAHAAGLPVVAHALDEVMVARALDAGVDELAHVPTSRLSEGLVERLVDARVAVTSTLQTFFSAGVGAAAAQNAAALVRAGVTLRYGTDGDGTGARPGVDPRELDRLAAAGLGRWGALRAATVGVAGAAGMHHYTGLLTVGAPADLVLLGSDPVVEPLAWQAPQLVVAAGTVVASAAPDGSPAPPFARLGR